jgi:HAMP domain-containing protein
MRLFKTLLLLMLLASVIPTALVAWLTVADTRELLTRDAQELAQERVKQLGLKTRILLEEPTRAAVALARVTSFFQLARPEQQTHLAAILTQRRELTALTVFDVGGKRIPLLQAFALRDLPPTELAEHESRANLLLPAPGLVYSQVYWSAARNEPVITLAYPIGDPVQGYGAAEVSLRPVVEMLAAEKVGSSGVAYVVDADGRLVAGGPGLGSVKNGAALAERPVVAHLVRILGGSPHAETFHVGNFGEGSQRVVGAYAALPDLGWAVVSERPMELAYSQVAAMERRSVWVLCIAVVVALALAAAFSRSVTRPLKGFIGGALELAHGKFGVQVPAPQKNELGDLARTFNYMSSQLLASNEETRRLYEGLEQGYLDTIVALANAVDSKDAYTRGHSQRVSEISVAIGTELGLTTRELKWLKFGGILHDVGKIGIIESILCKQSRLTEDEMVIMREHPEIGDGMVRAITFLEPARAAIRSHHEKWDGTGYPDRLQGKDIPLIARVVNCADTFDACTSTRPYQKAMPLDQALAIMEKLRATQLDPDVLDALRRVVEKKQVRVEGDGPVKLAS